MIIIVLVLLGLCFGSFINALVWRIHQQSKSRGKSKKYSITSGHSMCPHCKHRLVAKDLIPVLSWIELRGRCRYCQAKIGWQYPLVELAMVGVLLVSYLGWPYSFSLVGIAAFGVWLACQVVLLALVVYDVRWMLLPDRLVLPLTIAASSLVSLLAVEQGNANWLIGPVLGALFLSGLFWLLFQVSDGNWIGGGDVKIAVALGLIAGGLIESILLLFIASLLGTLVSVPLLMRGKKTSHKVPFGPFLITAAFVVFLWGSVVLDWYNRLIGA